MNEPILTELDGKARPWSRTEAVTFWCGSRSRNVLKWSLKIVRLGVYRRFLQKFAIIKLYIP